MVFILLFVNKSNLIGLGVDSITWFLMLRLLKYPMNGDIPSSNGKAILMSTHNIGFYEEISKIIT